MSKIDEDEHPVAHADGVGALREEADVDRAAHAGDLGLGDVMVLVDQFNDLAGDAKAHG
jgi:hypothetical protein